MQTDFDLPIANVLHTSCPHYYRFGQDGESEEAFAARMAQDLEDLILSEGPDTIAAFIAEPIMGAGGVIMPPKGYFEKVNAILAKYDIRFIADEVICGFGRTGKWFGTETFGMKAQSISMAKAITSAYFPLSALTIEEDLYQAMLDESRKLGTFGHGYTYTAHPVGCAVALKTIEIYQRDKIIENAAKDGAALPVAPAQAGGPSAGWRGARHRPHRRHRTCGRQGQQAVLRPKRMVGATTVNTMQELGLIVRNIQDSVALCPPLIITTDEMHEMFDIVERGLDQMEAWVRKEGARNA